MTDLEQRIAHLSPEKRALLEQYLLKQETLAAGRSAIPRRDPADRCPLSFAQQRLWFLDQLQPGSPVYNIACALHLTGPLNRSVLEQSLGEIARRHETLRTTFRLVEDQPLQVIAPSMAVTLSLVDLQDLPETEREAEALRLTAEEARQPFDLAQGPLFRARLLRSGIDEHVLLLALHHIVADGWSMGVLVRELGTLYAAFAAGKPSPLAELPIQYADFAVWQRQGLQGEVLESQLSYWKQQLAGAPAVLELPTDRPRPAAQSFRGASTHRPPSTTPAGRCRPSGGAGGGAPGGSRSMLLQPSLARALKALSQREGVTLFMTLLAAFQTLLGRYTGPDDIVVGTPIANRDRVEVEELIGFFVNTLVLRTDLSGDPRFRELLGRVREVALGAYAHQELPFEKLVEELHPERVPGHQPLFQVMFALQNAPMPPWELAGLTVRPRPLELGTAKFDLTLSLAESECGLAGSLEYNRDLFDAATIQRMVGHYETLLAGVAADPEQRLSRLPLLTGAERHQILVEWNDTRADYPRDLSLPQLFEAQVKRTPDAVALVKASQHWTYRELNARANRLAHRLRKLGVAPEVLVGLCVERSLEMVVGMLGILKAGGAYLPLDPSCPRERLAFMLDDSGAPVLLTQERLSCDLPATGATVVCLDSQWEATAGGSEEDPAGEITAENLAYVIYTSGSTGSPKGVAVPHRAVSRLVMNTNYVRLEARDAVAQIANCSFDATTFEVWGALLHGARLVLMEHEVALSPQEFAAEIRRHRISVLFLTTALFNHLADEVPEAFRSVRHLLFGGEAVDPRRVRAVLASEPPERLLHVYGPTEGTTFASWHLVQEVPDGATVVPIGRPVSNTRLYLLDRNLQPVPIGIPGELHIGGDGLARGYLDRPELNAEKFIPDLYSTEPGARLYKTGDLARCRADGSLEFLGRLDQQVKLRGFRVEPGEIEALLNQHPAVRESVVVAREDRPGEKRLAAYVVPQPGQAPGSTELRSFVKAKLPEYMVPAVFVLLEALPLTPSGKVDRRALPALDPAGQERGAPPRSGGPAFEAPRDLLELQLTHLWQQLLRVQPIGIRDSFFDLGGHSLLGARLLARIEKSFGKKIPLATLFQTPTVEQLADILRQEGGAPEWSSLVALQPTGSRPPFFCVHGIGDGVMCYADLGRHLGPDQPVYGLLGPKLSREQAGHSQVGEMAAHYIREVRHLQAEGPYFLGGY